MVSDETLRERARAALAKISSVTFASTEEGASENDVDERTEILAQFLAIKSIAMHIHMELMKLMPDGDRAAIDRNLPILTVELKCGADVSRKSSG
jgi:hypothetical protein